VPQLQLLHCLEAPARAANRSSSTASRRRPAAREAPAAFDLLTRTLVPFRYVETGAVDLRHARR